MAENTNNLCPHFLWYITKVHKNSVFKIKCSKNIRQKFWLLFVLTFILSINNATAAPQSAKISKTIVINRHLTNSSIDLPTSVTTTLMYNKRLRKRHSKRHSNGFDYSNLNSSNLEWINPCGGFYVASNLPTGSNTRNNQMINEIYRLLRKTAKNELKTLKSYQQFIEIHNIHIWKYYNNYTFLPKLKINSSIALRRWYRNMQTYVASFAYLRRVQLKFEQDRPESPIAHELKLLLKSSRVMLCELEAAVNGTRVYSEKETLEYLTREQMEKRLKLRTKRRIDKHSNDKEAPDNLDLKFVKHYYYDFLKTMWQVLLLARNDQKPLKIIKNHQKAFNEVQKINTSRSHKGKKRNNSTLRRRKRIQRKS